ENDIVALRLGRAEARFSYGTAASIAQGLRVASNAAFRADRVPLDERQALRRALPDELSAAPPHAERRQTSEARRPGPRWEVRVEGSLVALQIGNVVARLEPDAALAVAGWMRLRAREAKRWAGDRSRTIRAAGLLTDAETNYRTGAV